MISIRKHISEAEERDRLCSELEVSYIAALDTVSESLIPVSEALVEHHRPRIRQLAAQLKGGITREAIRTARLALESELTTFWEKSCQLLGHQEKEVKKILQCLSQVASVVASQGRANSSRLTEFTKNLESIAQMNDLPEIRRRLTREVSELRQVAVDVGKGSEEAVEQLREELRTFRTKLHESEQLANTDPLTNLANRRAGEQKIQCLISDRRPFSLLLFDLDRFKSVNDRWGHQSGDAVLLEFARRLSAGVRGEDTICRWGGDEFLAILPECGLRKANERASQIRANFQREYGFRVDGMLVKLAIQASIGVAEWQNGESADSIFRRADEQLYQSKARRIAV
ncbi:GGDEF domain-containing protein [uncultured Paludibaculum sp.]|uniref:GGDEF domain-containing protein n=1 Tax=uncultured Paludibaculum sp. TaxID=1765020 RepID=UPI002AAB5AAC|nr:GGDEF domain-containing protein [uncultured Paludibaculum sp.]